jgi:hypothetical protein
MIKRSEGRPETTQEELPAEPSANGVFLIRNNLNNKVFLGTGLDLHGIINRHKFQLNNGVHQNKLLQADWNEFGSSNFAFEIVDELTPRGGVEFDYRKELEFLEKLWLEKLQPFGDCGYNTPKPAEMLRRMTQNSKR